MTAVAENGSSFETTRQRVLRDLALSDQAVLEQSLVVLDRQVPHVVMYQIPGRISGVGEQFVVGEVTVCRAEVEVAGQQGVGIVLGRQAAFARWVAISDALLRGPLRIAAEASILQPVRQLRRAVENDRARCAEATLVDFSTMARGDS
jgi:alpha-D-ribose 1-methylphosphonate 5-triphosphate synthase subunit PhnG